MECDSCGSRNIARREVEGHLLFECNLCGNLEGDDAAITHIEELRVGRDRGIDEEVIPLVTALESSGVFRLVQASAGNPKRNESPHVFFHLTKNDTTYLERLLKSLELANRETKLRWIVELTLQREIVYVLRPRFWVPPSQVTPDDIRVARTDLATIARRLRRDLALSWWR